MRTLAFIGAVLLILLGLFQGQEDEVWLPVNEVRIAGDLRFSSELELMTSYKELIGVSMFSQDMADLASLALMPAWVKSAQVRRVWPATIEIHITEHEPLAYWNNGKLLTADGRIIAPANLPQLPLVSLNGPEGTEKSVLDQFGLVSQMLAPTELRVHKLQLESRGAWNITFTNGVMVKLGRDEVLSRLARFVAVYKSDLSGRIGRISSVDARYPHGVAVKWRDEE